MTTNIPIFKKNLPTNKAYYVVVQNLINNKNNILINKK